MHLLNTVSNIKSLFNNKALIYVALIFTEKNFNVGKYLEIELEFRTSELNGILISVAEPIGSPA